MKSLTQILTGFFLLLPVGKNLKVNKKKKTKYLAKKAPNNLT